MTLGRLDDLPGECAYCGLTLTWTDEPRPWVDGLGKRTCAARVRLLGLHRPPHATIVNMLDDSGVAALGFALAAVVLAGALGILWALGRLLFE